MCPAILPPPHGSFFFLSSCAAGHGAPSYRAARNGSLARLRALARGPKRHARSTILFLRQAPPPCRTGTLVYLILPRGPKWHARCSRPDTACPLSFALLRAARNGTLAARGLARWTLFIPYMFVFMLLGYFNANSCRRQCKKLQKRNGENSPQHLQITRPSETCTTTGHLLQWDH